jgi:hypothetical protein
MVPSITDWDKCRAQCPVAKPKPPVVPGAQLKLDVAGPDETDVDRKELRLLWEDEFIMYSCENTSLVLDRQVTAGCMTGTIF